MRLEMLKEEFSICKLPDSAKIDFRSAFLFFARTRDEVSCVCESDYIPKNALQTESGWGAFRVSGTLEFGMIGVIARITNVLAKEEISVFVVSTFDTDYFLIKKNGIEKAVSALERNGYSFR